MTSTLSLLPITQGFPALRRGVIHGYPSEEWIGALAHFDVSIPQARAQLSGLLSDAFLHRRGAELLQIADWALENSTMRPTVRRALLAAWTRGEDPHHQIGDWMLSRLFDGDPLRLWMANTKQGSVGSVFLGHQKTWSQAMWLVDRLQDSAPSRLNRLPWANYMRFFEEHPLAPSRYPDPELFAALVSVAPPATLPLMKDTVARLDKGLGDRSISPAAWMWGACLVARLSSQGMALSERPGLWRFIVNDPVQGQDLCPVLVTDVLSRNDPDLRAKLIETAMPTRRPRLLSMCEVFDLDARTAPAPARKPRAARL